MKHDKEYMKIKNYVKRLCEDSIIDLSEKVGLNEYDTKLLSLISKNETKIGVCMQYHISEHKYWSDTKRIFAKIDDYLKREI